LDSNIVNLKSDPDAGLYIQFFNKYRDSGPSSLETVLFTLNDEKTSLGDVSESYSDDTSGFKNGKPVKTG